MVRSFRLLGSMLILLTVGLWVAGAAGLIPAGVDESWSGLTLKAGMIALASALALRLMAPLANRMRNGSCAACGRSTARGHTYCLDHLQQTVNATRDQARNLASPSPRPRP